MNDPSILSLSFRNEKSLFKNKNAATLGIDTLKHIYPNSMCLMTDVSGIYNNSYNTLLNKFDYSIIDSDFFMITDPLNWVSFIYYDDRSYHYFNNRLKIYYAQSSKYMLLKDLYHRTNESIMSIVNQNINSMIVSDVVILNSPVMLDKYIIPLMKRYYTNQTIQLLKEKSIYLPGPNVYNFTFNSSILTNKDFNVIRFIWNNRFVLEKKFNIFLNIVKKFQDKYPNIPTELYITAKKGDVKKSYEKQLLETIHNVFFVGTLEGEEYKKLLLKTNVAILTTKAEGFSISITDVIRTGNAILSSKKCTPCADIFGEQYSHNEDELVESIKKIYEDEQYRENNIKYHNEKLSLIVPTEKEYYNVLTTKLQEGFKNKLDLYNDKVTGHLKIILNFIERNKIVTKNEIYQVLGFNPYLTKWWSDYYYKMRKHNVYTKFINGMVYYYFDERDATQLQKMYDSSISSLFD